jgi:hypothetical protein
LPLHVGHGDGGGGGPTGQAIVAQALPAAQGGGQGWGHQAAVRLLVGVPVTLVRHGGGQRIIAVLLGAPAGGQGGGHVLEALAPAA